MAGDERLRIDIDASLVEQAKNALIKFNEKMTEGLDLLNNIGWGNNELKTLNKELAGISSAMSSYTKTVREFNKVSSENLLAEQKINRERERSQVVYSKLATEAAKRVTAEQRTQTEIERTRKTVAQAELTEYRLAAAREKQIQRAEQLSRPYTKLNQDLKEQARVLQDIAAQQARGGKIDTGNVQRAVTEYNRLKNELDATNQKFKELTNTQEQNIDIMGMLKTAMGTFIGILTSDIFRAISTWFREFASSISKAGVELDALNNTMLAATGGWEQGGREIKWLIDMSNRLGLSFGDVSDSYSKFMTSFTRSGGTIRQSRQIFEDLSTAMVSLHLPAERMKGVFVALEQMANKGTVQSEELKRQLGNALPGAFELAAESMGILPSKLMDMMQKGEVFSKDFLPAFAATVKAALGQSIDIASMQFNASMSRLYTSLDLLKMNIGQILNDALLPFVNGLVSVTQGLAKMAQWLNENRVAAYALASAFTVLATGTIMMNGKMIAAIWSTTALGKSFKLIGATIKALIPLIGGFNIATAGIPLLIGTLVAGVTTLGLAINDASKRAADISPYVGLSQQYATLTKEVLSLQSAMANGQTTMEEGNKLIGEYKNQFPELTEYVLQTGKSFDQLTEAELKHIVALGEHDAKTRALNERTKEMGSWQATLSAMCKVAWGGIVKWSKILWQTLVDVFKNIIAGAEAVVKAMGRVMTSVGLAMTNIVDKFGVFGHLLPQVKAWGTYLTNLGATLANPAGVAETYKKAAKDIGDWFNKSAFGVAVLDQKTQTANDNLIKKLQLISKNGKMAVSTLKTAQVSVAGLAGESSKTGKSGGKAGKSGTRSKTGTPDDEWTAFTKRISEMEKEMRIRLLNGKSIQDLASKYVELKQKQADVEKGITNLTAASKDSWSALNQQISDTENLIRANLAAGKSIDALIPSYVRLKQKQEEVVQKMKELTDPVLTGWEKLKKDADNLTKRYEGMIANSTAYTQAEIEQARQLAKNANAQVKYAEALKTTDDFFKITSRGATQLTNALVDDLFEPLQEGETLWSRFKDAGLSAIKSIASEWIKNRINLILMGGQAGWAKNMTGNRFTSMLQGIGAGLTAQPLEGYAAGTGTVALSNSANAVSTAFGKIKTALGVGDSGFGGSAISDAINNEIGIFNEQAQGLAQTLTSATEPAVGSAVSTISGVVNPATKAAGSIASMAAATPIASLGIGSMAATMGVLSPAAVAAAPALTAMGAALATIAANASTAATAMAALAVATAAESVAKIPFAGGFLAPVAAAATGAAIAGAALMTGAGIGVGATIAGAGQMLGGGLVGIGNTLSGGLSSVSKIIPHAKGGIVSSPTMFPMQGGNVGLAGEAGTEVIAPARRMSNGDIGVGAVQPKVTVNNYANAAVEVIKRPDNEMEIKITELNAMLSSSRSNRGMQSAQNRLSSKGRQIG